VTGLEERSSRPPLQLHLPVQGEKKTPPFAGILREATTGVEPV